MHLVDAAQEQDPFPTVRFDDTADRSEAHRALRLSAIGLAITGGVEFVVALLTGSVGLLGDSLHNLSDVSTSAVIFLGLRLSRRPASPTHPYGYERAEDLAGLGVALVIWASAVFAGVESVRKLTDHGTTAHPWWGVAAAITGIVGNQVVARYKGRVGRRIQSATLMADAKHSWLDAMSSAGALIGLCGVIAGWTWADAVAGLAVTLFIVHVGIEVTRGLVVHLMDGVDPDILAAAEKAAGQVPAVRHAHVRARWTGRSLLIEIEGFLDEHTTLQESERVGLALEEQVRSAVPEARAVLWNPRPMPT